MAGKLKRSESGTHSARRIARQRIDAALKMLDGKVVTDRSVHLARKELKKARATLRLLRGALGESKYKRENGALRDVARPLSAVRDGRMLVVALRSLLRYSGSHGVGLPLARFRRALRLNRAKRRSEVLDQPGILRRARRALRASRSRACRWRVGEHGWSVLGAGLRRTYAGGRRAFARARTVRSDERLHEWRKQTKYFWYQLQLFEPLQAGPAAKFESDAGKLAAFLGDDHDLAVLCERVVAARELFPTAASHRALLSLIVRCRAGLQHKAVVLGRRLYGEPPAAFSGRLEKRWRDWRRE